MSEIDRNIGEIAENLKIFVKNILIFDFIFVILCAKM